MDNVATLFRVDVGDDATMVAADPCIAKVIEIFPRRSGWYDFGNIHSDLIQSDTGDRLLETAVSLTLVLVATGLYVGWLGDAGTQPQFGERGEHCGSHCMVLPASGRLYFSRFSLFTDLLGPVFEAAIWCRPRAGSQQRNGIKCPCPTRLTLA